ncbi:phosphonate ABC transporter, permease protein PhnE [Roseibium polysiphoniae]|uniref:Phosphonate ABC transporter, permease protein PhnE n=1 Tax=Roseibium polysiphoniae TaxID=2571221 RepID=A0ABR9CCV0_9HYPH|nr:phosphonate ABC transporter, permease protein PhnE [Roseibium polysiphoniae]MBD8877726.1 phosphonate ABC transporter, permease protein PhnE [Roseibium polysiphoniae]
MTTSPSLSRSSEDVDAVLAHEKSARLRNLIGTGLVALFVLACLWLTETLNGPRLAEGLPAIGVILGEMVPPDFTRWQRWLSPLLDTLAMSVAGTALAVALSLPLGFLAAQNTTPNTTTYHIARLILNILRSIPELIMGIIFVAAVGFGMLPGVLALGLHSVGMVGKFFAEATGASKLQVIQSSVFPQVFPQFGDVTMYRWEYNFRASTVMGMVGASGIGTELVGSLRLLDYPQVGAILLVILGAVTLVDLLSTRLRRAFK